MAKNTDLNIRITGDSSSYTSQVFKATAANDALHKSVNGVSKGLIAINGPLGGVAGRFEALRGIMTSGAAAWVGFGAAVTGASAVLLSSIRTYDKYEQQQLKVQQLLETTGYAAGLSAQELQRNAEKVALGTLASVEGIQEAQGALLTFKSVQGDTFLEAIGLAQDMASVMGGSAKSNALQLGKALQDPVKGITALTRSGVSFTEGQQDMIRAMVEAGDKAGAQKIILRELAGQLNKTAAAQAQGFAGSVDTLSQRWDELQVKLADTGPAEKATQWINELANAFHLLAEEIEPTVDGLETKLAVLQARLNKGFNGRSGGSQKSAVLAEIEAINDQLEIARARAGDLESVASLIEKTQGRIADLEAQKPTSGGGRSGNAKNAARQQELAAEKAFLEELEGIRAREIEIDEKAAATQAKIKADEQAELEERNAKQLAKERAAAEQQLTNLRKTLADKKEVERMAYVERQQMIDEFRAKGIIDDAEQWQLETDNFENYQKRLTEIQKAELDQRAKDKSAADENAYIQLMNSIGLGAEAERAAHEKRMEYLADSLAQKRITQQQHDDMELSMKRYHAAAMLHIEAQAQAAVMGHAVTAMAALGKEKSKAYKIALAAQQAAAGFSIIMDTEKAAVSALAMMPGPPGVAYAGFIRGIGYSSAGIVMGQAFAGAFENGGIVPGTSYTGDNLVARVNSSEMILNRAQQAQLFGIANGKGGGSGSGGNTTVQVINASSNSTIKEQQSTGPDGRMIKQYVIADLDADEEITQRLMSKFRLNPYGS